LLPTSTLVATMLLLFSIVALTHYLSTDTLQVRLLHIFKFPEFLVVFFPLGTSSETPCHNSSCRDEHRWDALC